jgi:hypothetical protein
MWRLWFPNSKVSCPKLQHSLVSCYWDLCIQLMHYPCPVLHIWKIDTSFVRKKHQLGFRTKLDFLGWQMAKHPIYWNVQWKHWIESLIFRKPLDKLCTICVHLKFNLVCWKLIFQTRELYFNFIVFQYNLIWNWVNLCAAEGWADPVSLVAPVMLKIRW